MFLILDISYDKVMLKHKHFYLYPLSSALFVSSQTYFLLTRNVFKQFDTLVHSLVSISDIALQLFRVNG